MPTIGVYRIRCKRNNRAYVGGSEKSVENRFSYHKAMLRKNAHYSVALQKDWNLYGEKEFVFEVLERTDKTSVRAREQFHLDNTASSKKYNSHPNSVSSLGSKRTLAQRALASEKAKLRCTDEWRELVRQRVVAQHKLGKFGRSTWKDGTAETVRRKTSGKNNPMFGTTGSAAHPAFGRVTTPEQRARYRQAAIKREAKKRDLSPKD
jgi:group I intron endonuclease